MATRHSASMGGALARAAASGMLAASSIGCAGRDGAARAGDPAAMPEYPPVATAEPQGPQGRARAPLMIATSGKPRTGVAASPETEVRSAPCCAGKNACKGMGGCKTANNACKGQNPCKGTGGCKVLPCP